MIKTLLLATTAVLFTGGIAIAQTTPTGSSETTEMSGFSSWDEETQDAFFMNGMPRSDTEIRSGWDSLETGQQEQILENCEAMSADAGSTGTATDTQSDTAASTTTTTTGTVAGTTGSATGTSTDTQATATPSTSTTTGTSAETTGSTGAGSDAGASVMPDMASMQTFCDQVQSY
ncbi:MAG: hypothetical protein MEQ84_13005 [Mesorhizobium sp.]|nr:hypothetical protein [Mesorhizobium sp.]